MEIPIEESKKLEPGTHKGRITKISYRIEPYEYTDVHIKLENDVEVKAGFPTSVTEDSKLGKMLTRFGAILEIGKSIDPEKVLLNKDCTFQSINETTNKGTFPKIIGDSLSPV